MPWEPVGNISGPGTDVDSLPAAVALDGSEAIPGVQNGGGVKFTTDQLGPSLAGARLGVAKNRHRIFTDFNGVSTTLTTDNAKIPESYGLAYRKSGTGTQLAQAESTFLVLPGVAQLETGSTSTGRSSVSQSTGFNFDRTLRYEFGCYAFLSAVSTAGERHECRYGFANLWTISYSTVPTDGFYFRSKHGETNYEAVCATDGVEEAVDTGVEIDLDAHNFYLIQDQGEVNFYIDSVLVATITKSIPDDTEALSGGAGIYKWNNGTTSISLYIDMIGIDVDITEFRPQMMMP